MRTIACTAPAAALLLAVLLLLPSTAAVAAADDTSYEDDGITPSIRGCTGELPVSCDLRDRGLITGVKNQGQDGTCWAFATTDVLENAMLRTGRYDAATLALSPMQLVYTQFNDLADPDGGLAADHIAVSSHKTLLMMGGADIYECYALAAGRGPVTAATVPAASADLPADFTLADEDVYQHDAVRVTGVLRLNGDDVTGMKSLVAAGYALTFSLVYDHANILKGSDGTVSYYDTTPDQADNHSVIVVGYDDRYAASHFRTAPAGDGAWLCRNSWGEDWSDGGYFWASYYGNGRSMICTYDVAEADWCDHTYQYDGGASTRRDLTYGGTGSMANVFTAGSPQRLTAASFWCLHSAGTDYTVRVYTGLTDPTDPTSGRLAAAVSGTTGFAGYQTVTLPNTVGLRAGETFAVAVTLTDADEAVYLAVDTDEKEISGYADPDPTYFIYDSGAAAGQSFVSADGESWEDLGADGSSNVRVKAFTVDAPAGADALAWEPLLAALLVAAAVTGALFWSRRA